MITDFLQHHREWDAAQPPAPGTPLAAVRNADDFFTHGLLEPNGVIFGVAEGDGMLLHRTVVYPGKLAKNVFHTPVRFRVQSMRLADLAEQGYRFYDPTGAEFAATPADTLRRARAMDKEGSGLMGDFSDVGDDFLYTCLSGKPMLDYIRRHSDTGRHLSLQLSLKDVLTSFDFVRKRYAPEDGSARTARINRLVALLHELAEMYSVRVFDRALCMGDGMVARFAALPRESAEEQKMLQQAKNASELVENGLQSELRLCSYKAFASRGGQNQVSAQRFYWFGSERKRLRARNVALHQLAARPKFSLTECNSEHFCHLCCDGKEKCPQLRSFFLKPVGKMVVPNLSWLNPFKKIYTIIKTVTTCLRIGAILLAFAKDEKARRQA